MEQETEVTEEAPTHMSPIKVAEAAGVKPQMVYNYIKKAYVAHDIVDGKIRVPLTTPLDDEGNANRGKGATEWIDTYTARKVERETKRQAKLEAELAGTSAEA